MPRSLWISLLVLALALAAVQGHEADFYAAKPPATPFIAAVNQARKEYLAKVDASLCPEAHALDSALRKENPAERFFLLWPHEAVWADFLCGNWPALLDPVRYSSNLLLKLAGRTAPDADGLGIPLKARFQRERGRIADRIAAEVREEEPREFLSLYLASLIPSTPHDQVEVSKRADRWLAQHPRSPYGDFVRGEIRKAFVHAPFGFGGSVLAGAFLPSESLGPNLERLGGLGFALEFLAHRVSLRGALIVDYGSGLERDLVYDSLEWKRGGDVSMSYGEVQLGLETLRRPRTIFEPFLSYGFVQMKNGDAEDSLEKAEDYRFLQNFPTWGAGVRAHWYFADPYRQQIGYAGLVLGRRFFDLEKKFPGMGGDEWYLEIHLGARFRKQLVKLD